MKEIEKWKDIPSYEGFYQASNFGRIKSLDRLVRNPTGIGYRTRKGIVLKSNINKQGYLRVYLYKKSKKKTIKVHQLVAMAFLNHKLSGMKFVINHKNVDDLNNKLNNRLDNLEITTQRLNSNKVHLKNSSDFIGVSWNKKRNKWESQIQINKKKVFLGYYKIEKNAHLAYQKALNNHLKIKL